MHLLDGVGRQPYGASTRGLGTGDPSSPRLLVDSAHPPPPPFSPIRPLIPPPHLTPAGAPSALFKRAMGAAANQGGGRGGGDGPPSSGTGAGLRCALPLPNLALSFGKAPEGRLAVGGDFDHVQLFDMTMPYCAPGSRVVPKPVAASVVGHPVHLLRSSARFLCAASANCACGMPAAMGGPSRPTPLLPLSPTPYTATSPLLPSCPWNLPSSRLPVPLCLCWNASSLPSLLRFPACPPSPAADVVSLLDGSFRTPHRSVASLNVLHTHSGGIADMDAAGDLLITCGFTARSDGHLLGDSIVKVRPPPLPCLLPLPPSPYPLPVRTVDGQSPDLSTAAP